MGRWWETVEKMWSKKKKTNLQNWTNKKKMKTEKLDNEEVKAKLKEEEN